MYILLRFPQLLSIGQCFSTFLFVLQHTNKIKKSFEAHLEERPKFQNAINPREPMHKNYYLTNVVFCEMYTQKSVYIEILEEVNYTNMSHGLLVSAKMVCSFVFIQVPK